MHFYHSFYYYYYYYYNYYYYYYYCKFTFNCNFWRFYSIFNLVMRI